jgi:hypothetical protein
VMPPSVWASANGVKIAGMHSSETTKMVASPILLSINNLVIEVAIEYDLHR